MMTKKMESYNDRKQTREVVDKYKQTNTLAHNVNSP